MIRTELHVLKLRAFDHGRIDGRRRSGVLQKRRRIRRRSLRQRCPFGRGGRRCGADILHFAHEAKAALEHRANETLIGATVAQRAPCGTDARAERRLRNDAALPDHVEQFVLADDPVAVPDQVDEQIEHLGLDVHNCPGAPQLMLRHINLEIAEAKIQGGSRG